MKSPVTADQDVVLNYETVILEQRMVANKTYRIQVSMDDTLAVHYRISADWNTKAEYYWQYSRPAAMSID
jgi:hypothetical protein